MKRILSAAVLAVGLAVLGATPSFAATEKEKTFVDSYKKAFEAKDETTLKSFLYTKGANPQALEFFTMMMTADLGGKITSIELKDLTPEDVQKASAVQPMPDGTNAKLVLTPSKKLLYSIKNEDANGSSTSSSETFVAEFEGKYVIPVPGTVK